LLKLISTNRWSGAEYIDNMIQTADLQNSSISMRDSTEKQFSAEMTDAQKVLHIPKAKL
jgi:hypothetical protein